LPVRGEDCGGGLAEPVEQPMQAGREVVGDLADGRRSIPGQPIQVVALGVTEPQGARQRRHHLH
jgi:hypothetical protein